MDFNGNEMHNLYRFLKRNSPLFVPAYGRAIRINEYYTKVCIITFYNLITPMQFLCDRYGRVKHFYDPNVEIAVIE